MGHKCQTPPVTQVCGTWGICTATYLSINSNMVVICAGFFMNITVVSLGMPQNQTCCRTIEKWEHIDNCKANTCIWNQTCSHNKFKMQAPLLDQPVRAIYILPHSLFWYNHHIGLRQDFKTWVTLTYTATNYPLTSSGLFYQRMLEYGLVIKATALCLMQLLIRLCSSPCSESSMAS